MMKGIKSVAAVPLLPLSLSDFAIEHCCSLSENDSTWTIVDGAIGDGRRSDFVALVDLNARIFIYSVRKWI